jgi:hypothetical protein
MNNVFFFKMNFLENFTNFLEDFLPYKFSCYGSVHSFWSLNTSYYLQVEVKVAFSGAISVQQPRRLVVPLTLRSSPIRLRRRHVSQARETSASEGGIVRRNSRETLGSFTGRRAGTWDRFFHFPSKGRHAEDFSETRKIQQVWTRELGCQRQAC